MGAARRGRGGDAAEAAGVAAGPCAVGFGCPRCLPRGGRLVPGLLEHIEPSERQATVQVARHLPRILGREGEVRGLGATCRGLLTAIRWRAQLATVGPEFGEAHLAAQRLERRHSTDTARVVSRGA